MSPRRRPRQRASRAVTFDPMADFLLGGQIDAARHERTGTTTTVSSGDLTTHGVIVGMTGSGKTGLGIVLIEEALAGRHPDAADRPEGRPHQPLPHLPGPRADGLRAVGQRGRREEGRPDRAGVRRRSGDDVDEGPRRLGPRRPDDRRAARHGARSRSTRRARAAASGSTSSARCRRRPDMGDMEIVGDEIEGFVSGLLSLVDIDADPLSSREHILLSNLILHEWSAGRSLDLPTLVGMAQTPPIRKLGVFDVDAFFPPKDRTAFAMRLNGLLASPSFGAWLNGPPLDIAVDAAHRRTASRAARSSPPRTCPIRSGSSSRRSCCRSSSRGCAGRAARPTCGRCSTWTRWPATCRRPRCRRRRSRS